MGVMRWLVVSALIVWIRAPLAAEDGTPAATASEAAAAQMKGSEFFPLTAGRLIRVDREVMGVVVQDIRLTEIRSRKDAREFRVMLRLRNTTPRAAVPTLRVVFWSEKKPEIAFDIRGEVRHLSLSPQTTMRFLGDFEIGKSVRLSRLALVPLPPEPVVMRADRPLPVTSTPPEQLVQPGGQAGAGERPEATGGPDGQQLDPEQARRLQQAMEQYRAEVARMYLQQQMIPQANEMGTLAGIGPYGPVYRVTRGSGLNSLYVQSPNGWSSLQQMPMMMNPMSVWVDPFQRK